MKKLLVVMLWGVGLCSQAQQVEALIFREKIVDFGDIDEDKGLADHEFMFTNGSGRPIKILSVDASCGCTIPAWSQAPVAPGKTGFVKASFNPRGRPGYFNKTLTVLTDWDSNPILLQIKGQVVSGMYDATLSYPIANGNMRSRTKSLTIGKAYINREPVTKDYPIMNAGSVPLIFKSVEKPVYISVEVPASLAPQEKGTIRVTYDARRKNQFGFASDNILLTTDDPGEEVKSISVFASLEEYFPAPANEEALTVPVMQIREQTIDLGHFRSDATIEKNVVIRNTGKRDLQIRSLQGNCPCIAASMESMTIRGGDSAVMKISFKPQSRSGTQQKAVTLYSNDPRNPVQRISVLAFVED